MTNEHAWNLISTSIFSRLKYEENERGFKVTYSPLVADVPDAYQSSVDQRTGDLVIRFRYSSGQESATEFADAGIPSYLRLIVGKRSRRLLEIRFSIKKYLASINASALRDKSVDHRSEITDKMAEIIETLMPVTRVSVNGFNFPAVADTVKTYASDIREAIPV